MPGIPKPIVPPGAQFNISRTEWSVNPNQNRFDSNKVYYEKQEYVKKDEPLKLEPLSAFELLIPENAKYDSPSRTSWDVLSRINPIKLPYISEKKLIPELFRSELPYQKEEEEEEEEEDKKDDLFNILRTQQTYPIQINNRYEDDEEDTRPLWMRNL